MPLLFVMGKVLFGALMKKDVMAGFLWHADILHQIIEASGSGKRLLIFFVVF
jgi:hypothetical protein